MRQKGRSVCQDLSLLNERSTRNRLVLITLISASSMIVQKCVRRVAFQGIYRDTHKGKLKAFYPWCKHLLMVVKASVNGVRKTNRRIACVGGLWREYARYNTHRIDRPTVYKTRIKR